MYNPLLVRTKVGAGDDDDPNTTEPEADEVFGVGSNRGFRASLGLAAGETADVTVWVKNKRAGTWDSFAPLVAVGPGQQFGDVGPQSDIPSGQVFFQITNRTDAVDLPIYAQDR